MTSLAIGMDVGSTTVKAVVVDPTTKKILWSDYQRHHTKQPEYVLSMLQTILAAFPRDTDWRMFLTGSGAGPLVEPTGGKFVQEVNAGHAHRRASSSRRRLGDRAGRARRQDHHVQAGRRQRRQDRR